MEEPSTETDRRAGEGEYAHTTSSPFLDRSRDIGSNNITNPDCFPRAYHDLVTLVNSYTYALSSIDMLVMMQRRREAM